ncbi:MAG: hypothetical protein HYY25_15065 [Candidatus Wallbacteria bacterium]|nr:hypothetical protein [Candidatus Wallbacteria bacterium]
MNILRSWRACDRGAALGALLLVGSLDPVWAQPDLQVRNVVSPSSASVGQSIAIQSEIFNGGLTASLPHQLVLSLRPELATSSGQDIVLARADRALLPASASAVSTSVVIVPGTVTAGNYRVAATIDLLGGLDLDLTNNAGMSPTTLTVLIEALISLHRGLNLVALPIQPEPPRDSADFAADVGSPYIARFVTGPDGRGRLQTQVRGLTGEVPFPLEGNRGYFVMAQSATTLAVRGRPWPRSALTVTLPAGLSAIAFPRGVPASFTTSSLVELTGSSKVTRVVSAGSRGQLDSYVPNLTPDPVLEAGKGYIVSVGTPRALTLPEGP